MVAELNATKDVPELDSILGQTASPKPRSSVMADLVDDLRISVKYLLFDNEASHREIAKLYRLLEENK